MLMKLTPIRHSPQWPFECGECLLRFQIIKNCYVLKKVKILETQLRI